MSFELDIRKDAQGAIKFNFEAIFISDVHWGTKHCKAKMLYQFLNHINVPQMHLVGDMVDGWYMSKKESYNLGPYHRQSMAQILRLAQDGVKVTYEPGNHDETLRGKTLKNGKMHRKMTDKSLFGIEFKDTDIFIDATGRRFYVAHGDQFDPDIYKSDKGLAYKAGDLIITKLGDFDCWASDKFSREFTVAAGTKKAFKVIEERVMPNLKNAEKAALKEQFDGVIFGHSHLRGFKKMPSGITLINDGCSTDDGVEFAAVNKLGQWAIAKWTKTGLRVKPENEKQRLYSWADLNLEGEIHTPEITEDEASYNIDRIQRLLYRLWPPLERKEALVSRSDERPLAIPLPNPKLL
tara:strand:+ start:81793 stop:82845 length:1053 start_codon:yes stop_codon:yes gene_type:complete